MRKGYLIMENGRVFPGELYGPQTEAFGELVFSTGMSGYLETLTNPSNYGEIVVETFPMIGGYGLIPEDFESGGAYLNGFVVRDLCANPSNFRSTGSLEQFFKEQGVPCLSGVDTREITRIVRERGVMNACISDCADTSPLRLAKIAAYQVADAVNAVTCKKSTAEGAGRRVVLYDFGAKANIRRSLIKRGCEVVTVPASTPMAEILALEPAGIVLSNGPGDPAENVKIIQQLRFLFDTGIPMFGICLGHQLMALAHGAKTRKMKYGHRGETQPVQELVTGRVYITSQNHGYCVIGESIGPGARMSHQNANDGTCEGIAYERFPGFSVQFHPEAAAGPLDTGFLFDRFIALMEEVRANAAQ